MQNNAVWLKTLVNGFKVRVKFMPMNPKEAEKTSRLLKNFSVVVGVVTAEGPLSVDLSFVSGEQAVPVSPTMTLDDMIAGVRSSGYTVLPSNAGLPEFTGQNSPADVYAGGVPSPANLDGLPSAADLDAVTAEQESASGKSE